MSTEIIVAGSMKVKPEKRQAFLDLAQSCIQPSRSEPGCISYSFYEDRTEENQFLFFEEWQSREALEQHFQTAYFQQFAAQVPELFEGEVTIKIYQISGIEKL